MDLCVRVMVHTDLVNIYKSPSIVGMGISHFSHWDKTQELGLWSFQKSFLGIKNVCSKEAVCPYEGHLLKLGSTAHAQLQLSFLK